MVNEHIKKILRKSPAAYRLAKGMRDSIRETMSPSALSAMDKSSRKALEDALSLMERTNMKKLERSGSKLVLELGGGLRFLYDPKEAASLLGITMAGTYEAEETSFLENTVKQGWTVFDLGANYGWYAVNLSKWVGPKGNVHSFEPMPLAFRNLMENLRLNGCGNVKANELAVAEKSGRLSLFMEEGAGTVTASQFKDFGAETVVGASSLDDYSKKNGIKRIDLIRADIECGELNMLKGAQGIIRKFHPAFFLEINDPDPHAKTNLMLKEKYNFSQSDVFGWLAEQGYKSKAVTHNNFYFYKP